MLVAAAVSYGFGAAFARKYVVGLRPMVPAFIEVTSALRHGRHLRVSVRKPSRDRCGPSGDAIFAVLWLGFFGSGLAYLAFFRLIGAWGATRTSMVAYLLPVWGIALGFLVLNEPIQSGLVLGTALIIAGIAFVNTDRRSAARDSQQDPRRCPTVARPACADHSWPEAPINWASLAETQTRQTWYLDILTFQW